MEPPRRRSKQAPRVVAVLAGLLERAAERGDAESEGAATTDSAAAAAFRGRALPGIPVRRYAERIYRYAGCSPACFVVAYVYLDRLVARDADEEEEEEDGGEERVAPVSVGIDSYNVHRLLITSVLVAAKFMDDRHNNNAYFARVGGVEVSEMNALELHLLFALRFRLNVHPDTFARYCAALQCHILMADPTTTTIAAAVPPLLPSPGGDDDEGEAVMMMTKTEKAAVAHSRRHRRAVVHIMTTAAQ